MENIIFGESKEVEHIEPVESDPGYTITLTQPVPKEEPEPTDEEIELRKQAFMKLWQSIEHLQADPDFERLPIPFNWAAILDGLYHYKDPENVRKRLTEIELCKMNEIKEEVKEKLEEIEESKHLNNKKNKKRNKRKELKNN